MIINRDVLSQLCNAIPETHRPLAEALQGAARYAISNPNLSLQKSNIALGIIVRDLYEKVMDKRVSNSSTHTLLINKNFIAKIHPRRIYLLMNLVRKMTATTSNNIVDSKAAKIVLDYLTDICSWYIKQLASFAFYSTEDTEPLSKDQPFANFEFAVDDFESAAKWFLVAANEGHVSAQYNLGFLYNHGRGVTQDYTEAAKWYEFAANQNDSNAQHALGVLYHLGHGFEKDETLAAKLYEQAAQAGNADAQYNLGSLYNQGKGVIQNFDEAAKWYKLAVTQGNTSAQNNLGFLYHDGKGVSQSYEKAVELFTDAALNGDASAQITRTHNSTIPACTTLKIRPRHRKE